MRFLPLSENIETDKYLPTDTFEASEFSEQIENALEKLSSIQKTILILRTINCYDYKEISLIVNRNPENVRKQYERAKRKITNFLEYKKEGIRDEKNFIV